MSNMLLSKHKGPFAKYIITIVEATTAPPVHVPTVTTLVLVTSVALEKVYSIKMSKALTNANETVSKTRSRERCSQ